MLSEASRNISSYTLFPPLTCHFSAFRFARLDFPYSLSETASIVSLLLINPFVLLLLSPYYQPPIFIFAYPVGSSGGGRVIKVAGVPLRIPRLSATQCGCGRLDR